MPSLNIGACEQNGAHMAGILAVHLVSQVLEEACVIAAAADDSGQPWRYLSLLKNLRCGKLGVADGEDIDLLASQGDNYVVNENITQHHEMNTAAASLATSTPEKAVISVELLQRKQSGLMEFLVHEATNKPKSEINIIGQGDEELDMEQNDSKSTSAFINNLFDMSDVEHVIICDETRIISNNDEESDLLTDAITKIMESYANSAFDIGFAKTQLADETYVADKSASSSKHSDYSLLADAFTIKAETGIFFTENEVIIQENNYDKETTSVIEASIIVTEEVNIIQEGNENGTIDKNDVSFYENAYLTLNRDYEQGSDDEAEQRDLLPDPKSMALQEVELITADSSENLSTHRDPIEEDRNQLAAVSGVSGVSGSRKSKSSLMSKCKSQGARLLSCLRWWWRRKTPGKRKGVRPTQDAMRGICPLSPDARRRASSLLDNRELYSPVPGSKAVAWKFNTVNEALVNSTRWKDYSFEANPDERVEFY